VPHGEQDWTRERPEEGRESFLLNHQHFFGAHRTAYFSGLSSTAEKWI
jgi:hypothetical protein